jgi:hypothetical protein
MCSVYNRTFGDFPAKITVYTPYIYGSGQPYKQTVYITYCIYGYLPAKITVYTPYIYMALANPINIHCTLTIVYHYISFTWVSPC